MQIKSALIVHRKTLYQIYVQEHREPAVQRAIGRKDAAALRLKQSHQAYLDSMKRLVESLERRGIDYVCRWRAHVRSTRGYDLIISLGGDGTLLDLSHRVKDQTPVLGVNSDPQLSVGALCACTVGQLPAVLNKLEKGILRPAPVNRMRVRVDDEEVFGPVLNDVLIAHRCPAGLTRLEKRVVDADRAWPLKPGRGVPPKYRGSGLWVSTATGSTAAIHSAGGKVMARRSRRLQYLFREPYSGGAEPPRDVQGFIPPGKALVLINRMRRAMVFSDGEHRRVSLAYGQQVTLDNHPSPLRLVLPLGGGR